MTQVRYIVKNDVYAIQQPGGMFGSWRIKKQDEEHVTDFGAYVSLDRAKQLKRDLSRLVGEDPIREGDIGELIDEINDEDRFTERGGVVVYFLDSGDETYSFGYIGKVGRIKISRE